MIYGPLGIFLASLIEEIIAPIPSTLVIMGTSFLILKNNPISFSSVTTLFTNIVFPASLGVTLGSLFVYAIGYFAGKPFLKRWGKYLGFTWDDLEKTEKKFDGNRSNEILLFLVRAVPIIPSVAISVFCGFVRFDIKNYIIITFLGTIVRSFILGLIGWQFGSMYQTAANEISYLEEVSLLVIVIVFAIYLIYKRKKK
jgi:membrane protein DedA with SNARE-associated domain